MADNDRFTSSVLSFMLSTMPRKGHVRCSHNAFDTLHDSLISFILSKMPVKDAVRSSVLSKRWRFLYTQMPTLTFSRINSTCAISRDENIISNMLLQHLGNLEGFHLDWCYSPENVCKWAEYASQHNVQHLTLFDSPTPPALFSCSSLVTLRLHLHNLTSFPTSFAQFPHLISCYLCCVQMTDESLASLVSFCPLMQKLEMTHCFGVARAIISSSAIEHLNIHFQHGVKFVLVDCPKLQLMKAFMIKDLRVNGALFYELSYAVTHLEMYCGDTLMKLQLVFKDADINLRYTEFPTRLLEILGNFQSLKKLNIDLERHENIDFPLFKLFQRLPNLQIFSLLGLSLKGMVIPFYVTPPHHNLQKMSIDISEFGQKEVEIISCLLQSTPSLEVLEIQQPDEEHDKSQCLKFLEDIRFLGRASLLARIIVLGNNSQPIHVLGSMPTPTLSKYRLKKYDL